MDWTRELIANTVTLLAFSFLTLLCALILTRQFPKKQPQVFLILWVLWGFCVVLISAFALPGLLHIPAAAILALSIWWFWRSIPYATVAAAMTAVVLNLLLLLQKAGAPIWSLLIGCGLFALICILHKPSILPEQSELLTIGDKSQTKKFTLCVCLMVVALVLIVLWQEYLIWALSAFSAAHQRVLVTVTVLTVILLVFCLRRIAFDAMERIEALIDKQYQAEMLNLMQIIRSQRHDFNFHMQTISGLIENKQYQKCSEYIHEMVKAASKMNSMLPLQDPAISAMLNSFQEIASQQNITMDVTIHDDLSDLPCTVYEINTIIGNLLQNAIDEVNNHNRRQVQILTLRRGGYHIIKVTNPIHSGVELRDLFKPGYTTKQSHEGIGLATVDRLVSKHHGTIHPELIGESLSFIVRLPCIYTEKGTTS